MVNTDGCFFEYDTSREHDLVSCFYLYALRGLRKRTQLCAYLLLAKLHGVDTYLLLKANNAEVDDPHHRDRPESVGSANTSSAIEPEYFVPEEAARVPVVA